MARKMIQAGFPPAASLEFPPDVPALDAGTIQALEGVGVVTVSASVEPSGGLGTYTLSLYRSTTSGQRGNLLVSDIDLPYEDESVTGGVTYYYTLEVTDGVSTAYTSQVSATPEGDTASWAEGVWDLMVGGQPGHLNFDNNTVTLPMFGPVAMAASIIGETAEITFMLPGSVPGSMSLTHSNGSLSGTATAGGSTVAVTGTKASQSNELVAGTIVTLAGDEQVTINQGQAPSGGTGSYTRQLYRSTTGGQKGSAIVGATSLPYTDTGLTNGTTYYYVLEVSDGESTADTPQVGSTPQEAGNVQPMFAEDFENYTTNGTVAGGGNSRFQWVGSRETRVSDLISHTGSKSLRFRYDDTPQDSHVWAEQRFSILGSPLTECWVEYFLYYPDGTEGFGSVAMAHWDNPTATDNNKFFRLWGGGHSAYSGNRSKVGCSTMPLGGTGPLGYIIFEYTRHNSSGTGIFDSPRTWPTWEDDLGRWIRVRMHYKHVSAPGANDGVFRLWKDDTLVYQWLAVNQHYVPQYPYWDSGYLFGADNSHIATQAGGPIYIFIDDFKIWDQNPGW